MKPVAPRLYARRYDISVNQCLIWEVLIGLLRKPKQGPLEEGKIARWARLT